MAIYRTLYYTDVTVGVGGRVTIPQDMREDLGIEEGESVSYTHLTLPTIHLV
mgnify:CR=1 FL=1